MRSSAFRRRIQSSMLRSSRSPVVGGAFDLTGVMGAGAFEGTGAEGCDLGSSLACSRPIAMTCAMGGKFAILAASSGLRPRW